jgi:MFS family permease
MAAPPHLLLRFLLLYGALYCSFGLSSPFLPEFLTLRGVHPESLGLLLGAGTAVRLISAPVAGRLADVFRIFRLELSLFAILAAVVSLLYLPAHSLSVLALVNLTQAAMLAPLGTAVRRTRAVLVSIGEAEGFSELRVWLGARRRFGHLYRWRSGGWTRRERLGGRFHSLAYGRGAPCSGAIGAICA